MDVCLDVRIGVRTHAGPRDWWSAIRRPRVAWSTGMASAKREAWGVEGGVGWDGTTLERGERS
jgi:hypothetical protein